MLACRRQRRRAVHNEEGGFSADDSVPTCCRPGDPSCRPPPSEDAVIPRDILLRVLRREDEWRLCPAFQRVLDEYELPPAALATELQHRALVAHDLCACWLPIYWQTAHRAAQPREADPELWEATVWLRHYDRYLDTSKTAVGELVPDVPLVPMPPQPPPPPQLPPPPFHPQLVQAQQCHGLMSDYHRLGRPLVVVAGSGS